jgi:ribosomal protein S18 acetylase RimI-like enzyme
MVSAACCGIRFIAGRSVELERRSIAPDKSLEPTGLDLSLGARPMSVVIRKAGIQDAPELAAGECEVARTRGLLNALPGEIPEPAFVEKIESLRKTDRGLYVVAERGGEIVGHLLLDPMPLAANSHVCTLTIVVYPPWQGRGIGKQLLDHAIKWAEGNRNVEKIELMVRATNDRAIGLYRSHGFEEEGRMRHRLKEANGIYHDDIAMALFVDSHA